MVSKQLTVLLIGAGGREHAIAWKLSQSQYLKLLYVLPGNPGTSKIATNINGDWKNKDFIIEFVKQKGVDLTVIGPEDPLASGLADDLAGNGTLVFGPRKAAAKIESSKSFAKTFMKANRIPTPPFRVFREYTTATDYVQRFRKLGGDANEIVIKASGLASGKGTFLPPTFQEAESIIRDLMQNGIFGDSGKEIIVERRRKGKEVSLMVFTDGNTFVLTPPARDHKRLLDGDFGPNTGGMGAFAPVPINHTDLRHIAAKIVAPTLQGLDAQGIVFQGVLYLGLILTNHGFEVLEYNCRFGDPEAQVVLPLLESDLLEILVACAKGNLNELADTISWRNETAICVILCSSGYPDHPRVGYQIHGLESLPSNILIFHGGTRIVGENVVTTGGRVLGLTALSNTLASAIESVYEKVGHVNFEGMFYRRDIGHSK